MEFFAETKVSFWMCEDIVDSEAEVGDYHSGKNRARYRGGGSVAC